MPGRWRRGRRGFHGGGRGSCEGGRSGHAAVSEPVALGGGGQGADGHPGGLRSLSDPTERLDNSGKWPS